MNHLDSASDCGHSLVRYRLMVPLYIPMVTVLILFVNLAWLFCVICVLLAAVGDRVKRVCFVVSEMLVNSVKCYEIRRKEGDGGSASDRSIGITSPDNHQAVKGRVVDEDVKVLKE